LLHALLQRQRPLPRRPPVDQPQGPRPGDQGRFLPQVLRGAAPALPRRRRPRRSPRADLRAGARSGRRAGHALAQLALSRRRAARLDLDLRARAPARSPGVAGEPFGRLSRLRHEPGRRPVFRRQGRGLHLAARRRAGSPGAIRPPLVHRPRGARAAPERWLADGGARRRARRLRAPGLEGRRLVPRAGDPHSPPAMGDRGDTEGPVLPLRKAPAALRQGRLPRELQLEVRLAGEAISSYAAIRTNIIRVAPGEYWGWVGGAVALAVNWKLDRATTA